MPGFAGATRSQAIALSRRDPAKAQASAREYSIPHAFTTTRGLCACPDVDAVFVTSPNSLHLPDVLTAIEHRKPVLCEKPFAMNAKEAEQMVAAAKTAGVLLGVAQCFRFEDSVNWIRDRVQGGAIGKVVFARSEFSFASGHSARTWLTDEKLSGGGPIADVGVHSIDALRYILGEDPIRVRAFTHSDGEAGEVESSAAITLEFPSGALGNVMVSYRAAYRTPIEIVGTEGTVRAEDGLTVDHPITLELHHAGKLEERAEVTNNQTYARQFDAFAAAVLGESAFPVQGEEGWRNQIVLDAAYRSAADGLRDDILKYPL